MAPTHAVIAVAGTSLFLGSPSELALPLAVLGSQLPDLDSTKSLMGRVFYPIARWFEVRYSHRTITHSIVATGAIALLSSPLLYYTDLKTWLALPLGHFLSCVSDTCTKQGVALFWPSPVRAIYGNNPNLRLRTGSRVEYWILTLALIFSIWLMNINSAGGIMLNFNRLLGIKEGAIDFYNRYGSTHHVWVNIDGNRKSDRSSIKSRFFLVGQEGEELIVQDKAGIYKTGDDLLIDRITAEYGDLSRVIEQGLVLREDDLVSALRWVMEKYPGAGIYLSGTVQVDEADEILPTTLAGQYEIITKTDSSVTLKYCPIETAIQFLQDQYAYGVITLKIITPEPQL